MRRVLPERPRMVVEPGVTRTIMDGWLARGIPSHVQQAARLRLRLLDNIEDLGQLRGMPRLRLRRRRSATGGSYYVLGVEKGWELRFEWRRGAAFRVVLCEQS